MNLTKRFIHYLLCFILFSISLKYYEPDTNRVSYFSFSLQLDLMIGKLFIVF